MTTKHNQISVFIGIAPALALAVAVGVAQPAHAGHYFWEDIDLVAPPVIAELKSLGIDSTEALLVRALSAKDRKTLDGAVSLSGEELEQLVRVVELMQIDGVGPKAAKLLRAAGVGSVKDLGAKDPSALLDQIIAANAKTRHTDVNPDLLIVEDWVKRAQEAAHHVQ